MAEQNLASYDGKEITDKLGRKIVLRKPTIMDRYQLIKAIGKDSDIDSLQHMMMSTIFVAKIDGALFKTPKTLFEAEFALNKLEMEGVSAVLMALAEHELTEEDRVESVKK